MDFVNITDTLTTPVIILGLVVSFFIIIFAIILLFFAPYRIIGIIILIFYLILGLISGSYLGSKQFGVGIPVLIFIILLCIVLFLIINIPDYKCLTTVDNTKQNDITFCPNLNIENFNPIYLEGFSNPKGPTVMRGKWGYKVGNYFIDAKGNTINLTSNTIKNLRTQLDTKQKQCNRQIKSLKDNIKCKEDTLSLSAGPCITNNNEWGVILPKYGKKCVPMSVINKEVTKGKIDQGLLVKDKKDLDKKEEDETKLSKKEIKNRYDALLAKERDIQGYGDKEYTKCLTTDDKKKHDEICKKLYGKYYQSKDMIRCKTPLRNPKIANMMKLHNSDCECIFPKDLSKRSTKCLPTTSDFNYECQAQFGRNYGYEKILKGRSGCCGKDNNMARAICDTSSYKGMEIYGKTSECLPSNNYYEHLEDCKNKFNKNGFKVEDVQNIAGYNCSPGYFKAKCIIKY